MDIKTWLDSIGLAVYYGQFEENCIEIDDLAELTSEELKEDLGITKLGHRKQILKAIANLNNCNPEAQKIIDNYPYSIALPYKQMMDENSYFVKIQLMKDLFLNILKYLGLVTAAEYFSSNLKNKEIITLFRAKLFQPHFGNWNHFIRETLSYLEKEQHEFKIPELPLFYNQIESGKKVTKYNLQTSFTDELGDLQIITKSFTAIGGLINFRNRFIGHGVTLSPSKSKEVFNTYYPIMKNLLEKMSFVESYPMFKMNNRKKIPLIGTNLSEIDADIEIKEKVWLETSNGNLELTPFYIQPQQYIADTNNDVNLFIYEQYTGKRIVYFSPEQETGETSGEPVKILNNLLTSKEKSEPVELSSITSAEFSSILDSYSNQTVFELQKEHKIIEGIYQNRQTSERNFESFLKSDKKLFFLAAEAGAGKTNLMTEFFRISKSITTSCIFLKALYLPFKDILSNFQNILNVKDISNFANSNLINNSQSPFLIILDGCNEHQYPQQLLDSCCKLLCSTPDAGIKFVISWRVNSPHDFPDIDKQMSEYLYDGDTGSRSDTGINLLRDKASILKPMNKLEVSGLWKKLKKAGTFSPQFSYDELELRDRQFTNQLSNPLLLRLFLEQNHGKGLSRKRKDFRIWPNWYQNLETRIPGAHSLLKKFISIMFKNRSPILDFDSLFDIPELSDEIRNLSISSPYRRLVNLGVLSQYVKDGFIYLTFTMEGSYHYLLSRYIKLEIKYNNGFDLYEVIRKNKELPGIKEAAGLCLIDEILQNDLTNLFQFISCAEDSIQVSSLALAKAVTMNPIENIISQLSDDNYHSLIKAMLLSDFILEKNLQTELRYKLFNALVKKIKMFKIEHELKTQVWHKYNLICHEFGKYEESLHIAENLLTMQKEISSENSREMAAVYGRLAVAYRKLMRNTAIENVDKYGELALNYETKALDIRRKVLHPYHLEIAHSLDNLEKIFEYRKEWNKAVEFGEQLIKHYTKMFDPMHPLLASAYNNTAIVLREALQKNKSISYSHSAMEIVSKSLGETHLEMAYANWTLANTYLKFESYVDAVNTMKKTISILSKLIPEDHPNYILANKQLAEMKAKI